mgnify:CR=1 FL=1
MRTGLQSYLQCFERFKVEQFHRVQSKRYTDTIQGGNLGEGVEALPCYLDYDRRGGGDGFI